MKKVVEMTLLDIFLTKMAVFLGSCWLIGLIATFWPFQILIFLIQNKWYLLVGAILVSILPTRRVFSEMFGKKPKAKKRSKKK